MKNQLFQCPPQAFLELIDELDQNGLIVTCAPKEKLNEFLEKFLKKHFMDYLPDE